MIRPFALEIPWTGDLTEIEALVWRTVAPAVPLRWAVTRVAGNYLHVELAILEGNLSKFILKPGLISEPDDQSVRGSGGGLLTRMAEYPFIAVQILPTGIGLETGGYAGDGTPATNLLASATDLVVTHPNAVNAAALNWAAPNVLYVEGSLLNRWLAGRTGLLQVRGNTIGLLIDKGVRHAGGLTIVENAGNAFRSVAGGRLIQAETSAPLDLKLETNNSGASAGSLKNPEILLESARALIEQGADAIAVVADFTRLLDATQDASVAKYMIGQGPDPIGGLEAVLSHLITAVLNVPCAHAPYLRPSKDPCDPRAAAEELGTTFLPCILKGLWRAPRPSSTPTQAPNVIIAPEGALGGPGVLAAAMRGIPIVAVANPSIMRATSQALGIASYAAGNYLEAAGIVLALRTGIEPAALLKKQRETAPPNQ